MDVKKTLWDYGKSVIRELVKEPEKAAGAKPARLEDIKVDDLKREKVRLELEERKTLNEVKELEAQKRKLVDDVVKNAGNREAKIIYRKITEIDSHAANLDRLLDSLSQQARLINGLIQVKDLARIQKESGIGAILQDFDLQELVMFIDNAYIDGEFNQEKMNEMLGIMDRQGTERGKVEDEGFANFMSHVEAMREVMDDPQALEQKYQEINENLETKRASKENPQSGEEY